VRVDSADRSHVAGRLVAEPERPAGSTLIVAGTGEQALVLERTGVRNYSDVVRGALIVTPSL
jgi:hypothetical protein